MPASAIIYHALFKHQDTSHGLEAGFQGPHPLCKMESNPPRHPPPPPLLESYRQRCHIPGVSLREEVFEVLILKQYIIVQERQDNVH